MSPFVYDEIEMRDFENGFVRVCKNGKWGFISEQGEEVIPCMFDETIIPVLKNIPEREWKAALQRIEKRKNRMTSQMFLRMAVEELSDD